MRFAIFGDIHANLESFETVLADAKAQGCTDYVCLGDVVGYNANPRECLDLVRTLNCPVVQGNHDSYIASDHTLETVSPLAEFAIQWTRDQLLPEEKQWLNDLPMVREIAGFTIVHATLDTPRNWNYVLNQLDAASSFERQTTELCFFGHTHVPRAYIKNSSIIGLPFDRILLERGRSYFINIGSVGQPRDGDWRASYGIYDLKAQTVSLRRLPYDIETTQKKILQAGLPPRLADRLSFGK